MYDATDRGPGAAASRDNTREDEDPAELAGFLAETATRAPSVHDTQPWWFGFHGPRMSLHADTDRRLEAADPEGREMLISCGAALFTLRLAGRHLGYVPEVRVLPDADRPDLVADVTLDRRGEATGEERRWYAEIPHRRTHHGAFGLVPPPSALLSRLREQAHGEGAVLRLVAGDRARTALAALTEAAEQLQRLDPAHDAELARWSPRPGERRDDGMQGDGMQGDGMQGDGMQGDGMQGDGMQPALHTRDARNRGTGHPSRDFARGQKWGTGQTSGPDSEDRSGLVIRRPVTGVVAVLTTRDDTRIDWLRAGQALQRILLDASVHGVSAAFHTQALEVPELREFIRHRFCEGAYPQMLLRLGVVPSATPTGASAPAAR